MNVSEAFKSRSLKSMLGDHLLRNGLSRESNNAALQLLPGLSCHVNGSLTLKHRKVESVLSTVNKLVKGKLSLGAKILQGGVDKVFRKIFSVREEEQLLRASRCCLYTTAGPIAGRLFISTEKVAFCSDRAVAKVSSPDGGSLRFHYKIMIPLTKIQKMNQSESMKKPSQKYMQVMTTDDFEFWFAGFVSYKKTFKCLQQAISQNMIC